MNISSVGHSLKKPKKYSRNLFICSCECPIYSGNLRIIRYQNYGTRKQGIPGRPWFLDRVMVKYEVEPNKVLYRPRLQKNQWGTPQYWASFKQIIELPTIFSRLDEEDFIIRIGYFTRDSVQVPFINEISILNLEKYLMIKNREERRKKLNKINLL